MTTMTKNKDQIRVVLLNQNQWKIHSTEEATSSLSETCTKCLDETAKAIAGTEWDLGCVLVKTAVTNWFVPIASVRLDGASDKDFELVFVDPIRKYKAQILRWSSAAGLKALATQMISYMIQDFGGEPKQQFQIERVQPGSNTPLMRRFVNKDRVRWREVYLDEHGQEQIGMELN